jgi:hypothetical protein
VVVTRLRPQQHPSLTFSHHHHLLLPHRHQLRKSLNQLTKILRLRWKKPLKRLLMNLLKSPKLWLYR